MPAVRFHEVGDTSIDGIVCTYAENRSNVLNSLARPRAVPSRLCDNPTRIITEGVTIE